MSLYHTIVIEVAFTETLFSGEEFSGVIEVTIMATGVSQSPYEVVVVPAQSNPSSALGSYLFTRIHNFVLVSCFIYTCKYLPN